MGQTWETLSLAPKGTFVSGEFLVIPELGIKNNYAFAVAAIAAKGGVHLRPSFVHDSVALAMQSSSVQ